jgi:hypothetical protein
MVCQLCEYGDGHLGRKRTHEDQENDADKEENTSNKDGCSSCFGCGLEINGQRGHGIPLRRKIIVCGGVCFGLPLLYCVPSSCEESEVPESHDDERTECKASSKWWEL